MLKDDFNLLSIDPLIDQRYNKYNGKYIRCKDIEHLSGASSLNFFVCKKN